MLGPKNDLDLFALASKNKSMAAVLYHGSDNRFPQILEGFFKNRKEDTGDTHSLVRAPDTKNFEEALVGISFELIVVEQAALGTAPAEWLSSFKKKQPHVKCPVLLIGDENDPAKIIKHIESGYIDYVVNPPDKPLIIEKFIIYSTGKRDSALRQVYSMKLSQSADLAKPGFIEEFCEFDCKIRTGQKVTVNDLMILYAPPFSADGVTKGSVLGRCYECQEHQSFKGQFLASFFFVGVTADTLTHIRNSLRKTYVSGKSKG